MEHTEKCLAGGECNCALKEDNMVTIRIDETKRFLKLLSQVIDVLDRPHEFSATYRYNLMHMLDELHTKVGREFGNANRRTTG
jgi:hypothetical protein